MSIALVRSPSIVCKIVRPVKNALVKAYADYTRPALDGRVLRLAYQVGLGPAGPCATISRWLLTGEKEPGTQLQEDLPVSLR